MMSKPSQAMLDVGAEFPAPAGTLRQIAFGSDHVGLVLKAVLSDVCREAGYGVLDVGVHAADRVDYNDVALGVVRVVACGQAGLGVLVCGTGAGMQIAANRYPPIRAVAVNDLYTASFARSHNDANVACMGARLLAPGLAVAILARFLATPFDGGRHQRRVDKLSHPPAIDG